MEAKPIAEILNPTLVTLTSIKASPTTQKPFDEKQKGIWLKRWLDLERINPQIQELESAVFEFCRDYGKRPGRGRRLLITGGNGCGKTHTAKAIYRWASRMAIDLPWQMGNTGPRLPIAKILNWPTYIRSLYGHFDRADELEEIELLVVDDVGAEHDPSKFAAGELYLLLEHREFSWTVLTTNIPTAEWRERFDQRTASRLMRNFTMVSLEGVPDYNA